MSQVIGVWPNTTRLLIAYLTDRTGLPVYSRRPEDGWMSAAPCIWVDRLPGPPSDGYSKTYTFDIEAMHTDPDDLGSLVQMLEVYLFTLPSESDTRHQVDDVQCTAEFADVPADDIDLERSVGSFDITVRPQPAL
ncbi:MAG: hypothetical protein ACTH6N_02685 [Brachybacterium tyrofermentans]|uniref:hypothetical protein n=1 Tax=Brachybacterium tyrofermentans TaxID=47848 RepID=UPI001865DD10|nr:hypothetical protein [Brachybacterium tyrofermentans]